LIANDHVHHNITMSENDGTYVVPWNGSDTADADSAGVEDFGIFYEV
jgi:hypothetical protein